MLCRSWREGKRRRTYPPGPKGWPFIGSTFDFPTKKPWIEYCKWGKIYQSDILYSSALGNQILILNNRDDADELLEKRSHNYSGRPRIPIVDLMGWDSNIGLMDYDEKWKYHRKICQQTFHRKAATFYHPIQTRKVHEFLGNLLIRPDKFQEHCKMLAISIPMATMYGYDVKSFEDPFIEVAEKGQRLGNSLLVPGATLLNIFPILCRIPPIMGTQKFAAEIRKMTEQTQKLPMEYCRKALAEGTARPSFVTSFLERYTSETDEEAMTIERIAATVYSAGADTAISATKSFFYAMATFPEFQKKAQVEIDRIIGPERLPEYNDRESLPYVEAMYRELFRWRPPGPLGVPHFSANDDMYKGYVIPKGTAVFANIWAMAHDEKVYREPGKFNPERFLDADGKLNSDDRVLAYGFGRRVCVGQHVASATMWLFIAALLATFDIAKAKDELGNDIEIDDGYSDGMIRSAAQKTPFKCAITPRSPRALQLIEEALMKAQSK
ncbi:cytochrome P450 [Gymnopilus junonius]|uniref:Cytochrome P450 n=1 Tax=Gymnopilus junonius TaxID=109634 RepID=A0A9P5NC50_GYMJU|nr:cytochrome P450 [Gymnopilus junonius]